MESYITPLLENSKQAFFAAIEIHNKPVFPHRYQICTISLINAWELALKAFIASYNPEVKLLHPNGISKPFEECLGFVGSKLGKKFLLEKENLERLYEFRCEYIHFYSDNVDTILYSLFAKSVDLYNRFIFKYFDMNLSAETNLVLLPVGFKPPISPIDFLSNQSTLKESSTQIKTFIEKVLTSSKMLDENGIEEPILLTFNIAMINENRVKNADIVAAITKDENKGIISIPNVLRGVKLTNDESAKAIRIDEDSLFKTVYTQTSRQVYLKVKDQYPSLKQNKEYHEIMRKAKSDINLYKVRLMDVQNPDGIGQGFYSAAIYDLIDEHYGDNDDAISGAIVEL